MCPRTRFKWERGHREGAEPPLLPPKEDDLDLELQDRVGANGERRPRPESGSLHSLKE